MNTTSSESAGLIAEQPLRGVLSINISMASFVVGDTMMKLLGRSLPPTELIFLRSAVIVSALAVIMIVKRQWPRIQGALTWPLVLRCLSDCVNILAFATAIIHMHIAELYAIFLMSPFIMTVLAALFLKEPVGWRRWSAIGVGFCGVLLVVKPDPHALDQWALAGCLAAFAGAVRETMTQRIHANTPTIDVTFYSAICAGAVPFALGWNDSWLPLEGAQYLMVSVQALSWLVGTFLLIQACRLAPLSIVAAFRYTLLIWGGLSGYLVFGELPDAWSWAGAGLIVASGLYTFHRERVRRRVVASNVVPLN